MKIKRIQARDNHEALMKVKMELGPDAVIIHQRKVKPKGLLGFFKKPVIEVVAAKEDMPSSAMNTSVQAQRPLPTPVQRMKPITPVQSQVDPVEEELKQIREMINQLMQQQTDIDKGKVAIEESFIELIFRKNDLDQSVADKLVQNCQNSLHSMKDFQSDEHDIREIIRECVQQHVIIKPYDPRQQMIVFVGPTGVGKTTTIAKLAARASLNEGKSVGLISADTYRIAAVEQLRTYADILNIPLRVIYQASEVGEAIKQLSHLDLIMIDTAGRSHQDDQQMNELMGLLEQIPQKEIYLLLSCTTRQQDIRDILEKYQFLDDYKIIITKIDEASAFGTLVNVPVLTSKPISFMTTGQSVPDDIEAVTVEKIINLLIKEKP
ncbi:flagellar biosynthesis protein FlhF [Anoxynatronum buryatiense]|uniref:Flagellar biosynthesis protein FlhF n=1 Tax=Anoxynatronum buryatiense TaxID=489973 RepID=A0AA45WUD4_9CLOT|nr:flagellar biosynthesis protein FlhF [Anoxynatronum buryatiense]SMP47362.1 flagellar biosynthesis protein FlhF [Anoxynatronum buryatiense]